MEAPTDVPEPVVFGPDFPKFKQLMRHGRQQFESRTNQNLFLRDADFDDRGTYTMARLVESLGSWQDSLPLLFQQWRVDSDEFIDSVDFTDQPDWEASQAIAVLLGYCDTTQQESFFRQWCNALYTADIGKAWHDRREHFLGRVKQKGVGELMGEGDLFGSWENVVGSMLLGVLLDFPALIPEVWLNYVGYDKTAQEEEHLRDNPQRVDFVFFAEGRKCVIEIDGPSHYANFANSRYQVDERRYAKNLAIERSLRRQGWDIYRFANVEVDDAATSGVEAFRDLVIDLPGVPDRRRRASVESLNNLFGDFNAHYIPF